MATSVIKPMKVLSVEDRKLTRDSRDPFRLSTGKRDIPSNTQSVSGLRQQQHCCRPGGDPSYSMASSHAEVGR